MKKILLLILATTFLLIGCSKSEEVLTDDISGEEPKQLEELSETKEEEPIAQKEEKTYVNNNDISMSLGGRKLDKYDGEKEWDIRVEHITNLTILERKFNEETNQEDIIVELTLKNGETTIMGKLDLLYIYTDNLESWDLDWVAKHNNENFKVIAEIPEWEISTFTSEAPEGEALMDIHWNGEQFLTVGSNGTIYTSKDALNWENHSIDTWAELKKIIYNGSQYLVLANDSIEKGSSNIITSTDGIEWEITDYFGTEDPYVRFYPQDVIWDGVKYLALHQKEVYASRDGKVWAKQADGGVWGNKIAYSGDTYVIGGDKVSFTSNNGREWTKHDVYDYDTLPSFSPSSDIIWDENRFITAGWRGSIYTSSHGSSWKKVYSGEYTNVSSLKFLNSKYYLITPFDLAMSEDLTNWYLNKSPGLLNPDNYYRYNSAVWAEDKFVMVGQQWYLTSKPGDKAIFVTDFVDKPYEIKDGEYLKLDIEESFNENKPSDNNLSNSEVHKIVGTYDGSGSDSVYYDEVIFTNNGIMTQHDSKGGSFVYNIYEIIDDEYIKKWSMPDFKDQANDDEVMKLFEEKGGAVAFKYIRDNFTKDDFKYNKDSFLKIKYWFSGDILNLEYNTTSKFVENYVKVD